MLIRETRERLTLKDCNLHIVFINIHAPSKEKDEEKKEVFYDTLEKNIIRRQKI